MEQEKQEAEKKQNSKNVSDFNIIPFLCPSMPREGTPNNNTREGKDKKKSFA